MFAPGLAEGFAGYAADACAKAPALSRLLSRSRRQPFATGSPEQVALALFRHRADQSAPPVAAYSYLADTGQEPKAYCLRADPVHLQVDTRGLILFDASTFAFSHEESQALSDDVGAFLRQDGWHLNADQPQRWYLYGAHTPQLITTPLSLVRGRSIGDYLPQGHDAKEWQRRCNEIQMIMNSHPVNHRRETRGLPPVNSLWIWGGGVLSGGSHNAYSRVYANDAFVYGLGIKETALCAPVPPHAQALLQQSGRGDCTLLVLDACGDAAAYQDFARWNEAVENYEQRWFAPLLNALSRRQLNALELVPLNGYRYRMVYNRTWQFWKRSRSYKDILDGETTA